MLLVLNVALGAIQESRADAALALLKQRLSLKSRVRNATAPGSMPRPPSSFPVTLCRFR